MDVIDGSDAIGGNKFNAILLTAEHVRRDLRAFLILGWNVCFIHHCILSPLCFHAPLHTYAIAFMADSPPSMFLSRRTVTFTPSVNTFFSDCFGETEFLRLREKLMEAPKYTALRVNTLKIDPDMALIEVNNALASFNRRLTSSGRVGVVASRHSVVEDIIIVPSAPARPGFPQLSALPRDHVIIDCRCAEAVLRGSDIYAKGIWALSKGCNKIGVRVTIMALLDPTDVVRGSDVDECLKKPCSFVGVGVLKMARQEILGSVLGGLGIEVMERYGSDAPSMNGVLQSHVFMQNFPSAMVAHALDPRPGECVIDLCAAPGGKTSHIAQLMKNRGTVVALDHAYKKVARIKELCRRLGISIVHAFYADSVHAVLRPRNTTNPTTAPPSPEVTTAEKSFVCHHYPWDEGHNGLALTCKRCNYIDSSVSLPPSTKQKKPADPKHAKRDANRRALQLIKQQRKKQTRGKLNERQNLCAFETVSSVIADGKEREALKERETGEPHCVVRVKGFPAETFDKVLLDGPCSALGLRPRLTQRFTLSELEGIQAMQESLMFTAAALLKPGGTMVYSTCTFNPLENEVVVANALKRFPLKLIPLAIPARLVGAYGLPGHGLSDAECAMVRRFDPHGSDDTIGFFIARFEKIDSLRSEESKARFQAFQKAATK